MPIATVPYTESPLGFLLEDSASLNVSLVEVTAELLDDTLNRVDITFLVSPADYARIDNEALFHLMQDVRGAGSQRSFREEAPIEIEARLHPDCLRLIENEVDSIDEIGDYMLTLSRKDAEHALLSADSWYALRVKQEELLPLELQSPGRSLKSGYTTTWLESLTNDQEISPALGVLIETLNAEGWNWARGTDPSILMSRISSDSPEELWTVYTQIREDEHFCLVYSLCPIGFSVEQLGQVIEFISRANRDLPIGNFEMNDETLEIRFKTSLDYEGSTLTVPLMRQLLRANAAMMERYLPGLRALLEKGASVIDALHIVED